MGVGICCCGGSSNPCSCTWPSTLVYHGGLPLDLSSGTSQTTSTVPPYTCVWGGIPGAMSSTPTAISPTFIGYTQFNLPANSWWGGPFAGTSNGANCDFYLHLCVESCKLKATLFFVFTSGGQAGQSKGDAATIERYYTQTTCTPFVYTDGSKVGFNTVTGTHAGDDLTATGSTGLGDMGNYTTS